MAESCNKLSFITCLYLLEFLARCLSFLYVSYITLTFLEKAPSVPKERVNTKYIHILLVEIPIDSYFFSTLDYKVTNFSTRKIGKWNIYRSFLFLCCHFYICNILRYDSMLYC